MTILPGPQTLRVESEDGETKSQAVTVVVDNGNTLGFLGLGEGAVLTGTSHNIRLFTDAPNNTTFVLTATSALSSSPVGQAIVQNGVVEFTGVTLPDGPVTLEATLEGATHRPACLPMRAPPPACATETRAAINITVDVNSSSCLVSGATKPLLTVPGGTRQIANTTHDLDAATPDFKSPSWLIQRSPHPTR